MLLMHAVLALFCIEPVLRTIVVPAVLAVLCRVPMRPTWVHTWLGGLSAVGLVAAWVLTSHWAVVNLLGCSIVLFTVSVVQLPNARTATALFTLLLLYDVFWVFYSEMVFDSNVMLVSLDLVEVEGEDEERKKSGLQGESSGVVLPCPGEDSILMKRKESQHIFEDLETKRI